MADPPFVPLSFVRVPEDEMRRRATACEARAAARRTTRHFAREPVPRALIEHAIRTAGTAPSGAHMQPWTFVAVGDPALKARIREAAEAEERRTYAERMSDEWRAALAPLGTDAVKAHLTDAPWVVVLFRQVHGWHADGSKKTHYYTTESCGIAAGFFIQAVHEMGLATLTHTPSPMGFLAELLGRPENEKAFLVMPVGFPADDARVPDLRRKALHDISAWFDAPA